MLDSVFSVSVSQSCVTCKLCLQFLEWKGKQHRPYNSKLFYICLKLTFRSSVKYLEDSIFIWKFRDSHGITLEISRSLVYRFLVDQKTKRPLTTNNISLMSIDLEINFNKANTIIMSCLKLLGILILMFLNLL